MFIEYPKALYLHGWDDLSACFVVNDLAEEEAARLKGYRGLHEPVEAVAPAAVGDDAPDAPKRRGRPSKAVSE